MPLQKHTQRGLQNIQKQRSYETEQKSNLTGVRYRKKNLPDTKHTVTLGWTGGVMDLGGKGG